MIERNSHLQQQVSAKQQVVVCGDYLGGLPRQWTRPPTTCCLALTCCCRWLLRSITQAPGRNSLQLFQLPSGVQQIERRSIR